MSNWLSRMFTLPASTRAKLANVPGIHEAAGALQAATVAIVQSEIHATLGDTPATQALNDQIAQAVARAIPIPNSPLNLGDVVLAQVVGPFIPQAPVQPPPIDPNGPPPAVG